MTDKHREEVLNVCLAEVLASHGLSATPESITKKSSGGKALPDVLVQYRGMRLAIEGKYADAAKAEAQVANQAKDRIDSGIAQIAAAIQYPKELRTTPFTKLPPAIANAHLRFAVYSEVGSENWRDGSVPDLLDEIRRVHESMCKEDVVQRAAESIKGYLDGVAGLFLGHPTICDQLAEVLGVGRPGKEDKTTKDARLRTIASVAALTLANAFIFQEQLCASGVPGVVSLRDTLRHKDLVHRTIKHWDWICEQINYVPIFRLAADILAKIPGGASPEGAVRALAEKALEVCANKAALRHDLMGRIFHYLLHEAKYLGTYYTSVPAATLLLKLALDPNLWASNNFDNPKALKDFHVVDLTCGTGTLLMAACQAIADNFVVSNAKQHKKLDAKRLGKLHATLMEHVIHGYDVLPSAIHLTASTLSLLAPEVLFRKLHLYSMPLSVNRNVVLLGSLEFIERARSRTQLSLFDTETADSETREITGKGYVGATAVVPDTDLFVMNPPFVRSVGGNLLFGNLPNDKREKMQTNLKARVKECNLSASITAGLGSVFVAVADRYVKENGRLAFVLPAALATGVAWEETRDLIQKRYHLEYVVVSHDAARWNFSENTDLSELLFVARRLRDGEAKSSLTTTFINLWRNPSNVGDALAIARLIHTVKPAHILGDSYKGGAANLTELGRKYGECIACPMSSLLGGWWPTAFAQTELTRTAWSIAHGQLTLPGTSTTWPVPVKPLGKLADLGPDRRDIHDGFEVVDHATPYRAFWNHDAEKTTCMAQKSNKYLSPRTVAAKGRHRRDVNLLWPKAGATLISERLRLNSQRLSAVCLDNDVLTNTWWPVRFKKPDRRKDKALVLWQNSTLGLAVVILSRVATEGAWVQFKKPTMLAMPVLDVDSISKPKLDALAKTFDRIGRLDLDTLGKMSTDTVRRAIDDAISKALGLPDLTPIREMLGREPVVTNLSLVPADVVPTEEVPQMALLFA